MSYGSSWKTSRARERGECPGESGPSACWKLLKPFKGSSSDSCSFQIYGSNLRSFHGKKSFRSLEKPNRETCTRSKFQTEYIVLITEYGTVRIFCVILGNFRYCDFRVADLWADIGTREEPVVFVRHGMCEDRAI